MRRYSLLFVDLSIVALTTIGALIVRENGLATAAGVRDLLPYVILSLVAAVVIFPSLGLNRTIWRFSTINDLFAVITGSMIVVLSAVALGFAYNRLEGVARTLPIIQVLLMAFSMILVRVLARERERRRGVGIRLFEAEEQPVSRQVAIIVGIDGITESLLRFISEHVPEQIAIAGLVGRSDQHTGRRVHQHKILGKPEEIGRIIAELEVHGLVVDRIFVTRELASLAPAAREALLEVERTSRVKIVPVADRLVDMLVEATDDQEGEPALNLPSDDAFILTDEQQAAVLSKPYWKLKRLIDLIGATTLLVLTAPLQFIVAVIVIFDVGLPLAFYQHRPGLKGRYFKLYKLRTMGPAIRADGRRIPDHERLSDLGRFLRKSRLDELPQLIHILRGDMSIVGPRPLLPVDQPMVSTPRLLVRPGLTGYAQVKGGRVISATDKVALDVWYVLNASLWLDIKIVLETIPMLIGKERVDAPAVEMARNELIERGIFHPVAVVEQLGRAAQADGLLQAAARHPDAKTSKLDTGGDDQHNGSRPAAQIHSTPTPALPNSPVNGPRPPGQSSDGDDYYEKRRVI